MTGFGFSFMITGAIGGNSPARRATTAPSLFVQVWPYSPSTPCTGLTEFQNLQLGHCQCKVRPLKPQFPHT